MTEVGIVGLPQSGKTSLMTALTGAVLPHGAAPGEILRGVVSVPDPRVDRLSEIFKPKKTTHATIQFTDLVGAHGPLKKGELFTPAQMGHLRDMDLFILVIRAFKSDGIPHPLNRIDPLDDLDLFISECIFADLAIAEKRIERIEHDLRKGGAGKRKEDLEIEKAGLVDIRTALEAENPVSSVPLTPQQKTFYKGFGLLTAKIMIPLLNTSDLSDADQSNALKSMAEKLHQWNTRCQAWRFPEPVAVNTKLEMEIRDMFGVENMGGEEALQYYQEVGLTGPSCPQIITQAYSSLGLVSFLTAGEDEVRAWTIPHDCPAPVAAGTIHSDIEKGFIRAEVVSYEDFIKSGNMGDCRKHGTLRLEGREYHVKDGDIINFRFSV